MRILQTKKHLSDEELKERLSLSKGSYKYRNWLIISSVQSNYGKKAEDFAKILKLKNSLIYRVIEQYNKEGANFMRERKWGGRRKEREYMSPQQEQIFLLKITEQAIKGKILTYHDIKKLLENKIGKQVSKDYIWRLFKRNNWSKPCRAPIIPKTTKPKWLNLKKTPGEVGVLQAKVPS